MTKISKGDYFVARQDQGKDYLAKALEDSHGKAVEAVLEKNCHIQGMRHTFTQALSDVVVVLGSNPYPGKVYGFDVGALHRKRLTHDKFGDVHFFYKPEKQVLDDLRDSMTRVATKLNKQGLGFLIDNVVYEVMPYNGSGKYAGMFIRSKKADVQDRIQIRPEIMPASEYDYVWYHEIGHRLHLTFCHSSKKLNAQWLKLFSTSIKALTIKKDKSQQLLDMLIDGQEPPSDFKRGLDEEDALAFKWIIRTIQQINGLSIKDLDTLFEAEMKDEITKVWPVRSISHKELAPIVSEYATVNFKELFAECFAFYMTKKKLPDPIVKLMEKSISYGKANKDKIDGEE
jgi:hypothetical protein